MDKRKLAITLAVLACLAAPVGFATGTANQAVDTASKHAEMAVDATDKTTADKHLHHVINCLVGPDGKGFDSGFENPCQGMGNGALGDIQNAAEKAQLEKALTEAKKGLKAKTYETTKRDAKNVVKTLQHVLTMEATGEQ